MKSVAACTAAVIALMLAGATASEIQSLDLLRLLSNKPWLVLGPRPRWEPNDHDLEPRSNLQTSGNNEEVREPRNYVDDVIRDGWEKRSAVASVLNAGRRRRQPTPALGKDVTPYVGVGVLNDMGFFFDSLKDNLEILSSLSPEQRAFILQEPPNVLQSSYSGGGGLGISKLHALHPLRTMGLMRSYNRRSYTGPEVRYPNANEHDPGLLWTGLGRR